jgi:hypothetical protein
VTAKSQEKAERKAFFTRLPASTYRKLRKLAKLDPVEVKEEEEKGILFRFHLETHDRLKKLTLSRSLSGPEMTMQSMLVALIDKAQAKALETRRDMHDVVRQLIYSEKL